MDRPRTKSSMSFVVSDPISVAHPTQTDLRQSNLLTTFIESIVPSVTSEETSRKARILNRLESIVQEWVRTLDKSHENQTTRMNPRSRAQIHTFGSYRLGVSTIGSDIDCLCVVPNFVDRDAFFTTLLQKLLVEPGVTDVLPVRATRVPLIKFRYDDVEIDLLLSRLAYPRIPSSLDFTLDDILGNLDNESMLSLNGCRVANQTLNLIPNLQSFRTCLRMIKIWGKRRSRAQRA